eukprot:CAMPEP_0171335920 /NCGR_PEP_ID=MMETSP0878-20121228/5653_1 /TAXON_ID=67004 /ORGANISM="Thalassiosira weissflogii, Strain CCMP1336" /LENGTH=272 /DNA_ID=CAMNT_0011837263 /DNA_START=24 /DNA_END=842 /DNA_ORIENTATION=-
MTRRPSILPGNPTTALAIFALCLCYSTLSVISFSFSAPPSLVSSSASRPQCSSSSRRIFFSNIRLNSKEDEDGASSVGLWMSTAEASNDLTTMEGDDNNNDDEDEEEEEWIEEEFELLTERDFFDTEWKIGTVLDSSPDSIATTWVRLTTTDEGTNIATWGNSNKIIARGKWAIDVPSQFFSISRESLGGWFGKQIWAGTLEDYYFMEGTVRGWSPISPASVIGQWQGIRLGVSKEERGVAPWFAREEENEEEDGGEGENGMEFEGQEVEGE